MLVSSALALSDPAVCKPIKESVDCLNATGCSWCISHAVPSQCVDTVQAAKLPPSIFQCSPLQIEDPLVCEPIGNQTSCDATAGCVWCKCAAVPSKCYDAVQAKKLPGSIFHCDF